MSPLLRAMDRPLVKAETRTAKRRYDAPPSTPALFATDEHVALLVASRSPRESHAVLGQVNRLLARTVLSERGALKLRRERIVSVAASGGRAASLQLGDDCSLDASLVVVWSYLLVTRDPEARMQLHRYASSLRGMSPEELRPHEAFVHGGFLMGLVMPPPGPDGRMLDPPLVNVLDAYLHLMEDNLRRAQEIHANS